jgi:drug/metabolite transporter (DMT)-like permease
MGGSRALRGVFSGKLACGRCFRNIGGARMHWIVASLVSALFLGVYQLCTKHAVRENAVLPVLFLSNLCAATVWVALMGLQATNGVRLPDVLHVQPPTLLQHGQLALKSLIVAGSWVCSYFAVKHLPVSIGALAFSPATVQAWFGIYLALLFLPLAAGWKLRWWPRKAFHWRWSIPLLALSLLLADFVYFSALRDPEALIALVSSIRRGSTLVAFFGGLLLFGEHCHRQKLLAVAGVLVGIVTIVVG